MSEAVIVTLISVVGGGLITLLGTLVAKINRVGKDAAEARDQTANSHEINLRDDIDGKHVTVTDSLALILGALRGLQQSDQDQWTAINILRSGGGKECGHEH